MMNKLKLVLATVTLPLLIGASGSPIIDPLPLVSGNGVVALGQNKIANPTGPVNYPLGLTTNPLNIGPGGSGTGDVNQIGTGNLRFHLGGPASIWNFQDSVGTSMLQLVGGTPDTIVTKVSINPTMSGVVSGTLNNGNSDIFFNSTYSGTWTGTTPLSLFTYGSVTENINLTNAANAGVALSLLDLEMYSGGAQTVGRRHTGYLKFALQNTSGNLAAGSSSYTALNTECTINANDNGTGLTVTTANGTCYGENVVAGVGGTATNVWGIAGDEIDVYAATGTSLMDKVGLQIVQTPQDVVAGTRYNYGLLFASAATTASGWRYVMSFGRPGAYSPCGVMASCTLIGASGFTTTFNATDGVDLTNVVFSGSAFKSTGFSVNGAGNVTTVGVVLNTQLTYGTGAARGPTNMWIDGLGEIIKGTCTDVNRCAVNQLQVATQADVSASNDQLVALSVDAVINNSLAKGGAAAVWGTVSVQTTPTANNPGLDNYTGVVGSCQGGANVLPQIVGAYSSSCWGGDFTAHITKTGYWALHGVEIATACDGTCNAQITKILAVDLAAGHTTASALENVGISIASGGAATLDTAIALGGYEQANAIAPTGSVMRFEAHANTGPGPTIANGIDLSLGTFTSSAFKSPGFSVDGSGNIVANLVKTAGFTVSGLPAAGTAGRRAYVTDQLSSCPAVGAALTGGGAAKCPVFDNGVAWVSG